MASRCLQSLLADKLDICITINVSVSHVAYVVVIALILELLLMDRQIMPGTYYLFIWSCIYEY